MIVQKLKPYVTTFSAAVPIHCKHGDEVTVGGKVTQVLNLSDILKETEDKDFQTEGVYVTLDDGVGNNQIVLPSEIFKKASETFNGINIGDIFLAEGRVFQLDTTHTYKKANGKTVTVDNSNDETTRILAWDIKPLPSEEAKKVVEPQAE
ncbi:hypothetical protein QO179_23755 [Bacillus stercoris]|nr:hypothetical protein [Bacillus stercoris]